jgi:hypothetical protein
MKSKLDELKERIRSDIEKRILELSSYRSEIIAIYAKDDIPEDAKQILIQVNREINDLMSKLTNNRLS